jgi:predicted AAA+ superfamily ATPase
VHITGSNAYLLSGELATLLTGRYIETEVLPFSYTEYLDFLALNSQKSPKNESFADFLYHGGIPEAYNLLINSISNSLKSRNVKVDNETVINYLSHLSDALILYSVPRYDIKGKGLCDS